MQGLGSFTMWLFFIFICAALAFGFAAGMAWALFMTPPRVEPDHEPHDWSTL